MQFCIRDDDTSFFTAPEQLEQAYGAITKWGPVSLAIVPFHRAGTSKGVPERLRGRWTVHPLHENRDLVAYLRQAIAAGRFEAMLHGYYHDERDGHFEFHRGDDLTRRVLDGRKYLEELLATSVRVFVPPRNAIGAQGLRAIAAGNLHLGGVAGVRAGWPRLSPRTWRMWSKLRTWRRQGGSGVPWVLDLGNHREMAGTAVTPVSRTSVHEANFGAAVAVDGVFCAATHYWELGHRSEHRGEPRVGEQLQELVERARSTRGVEWRSMGDVLTRPGSALI